MNGIYWKRAGKVRVGDAIATRNNPWKPWRAVVVIGPPVIGDPPGVAGPFADLRTFPTTAAFLAAADRNVLVPIWKWSPNDRPDLFLVVEDDGLAPSVWEIIDEPTMDKTVPSRLPW